ncbi:hypothetical protein HYFRA_00007662 [Hymenoscyphus fraxineus]|uniref:Uncharacterized protein n=1 Tax=Hymenoscyphus fraxineus TaxID=746836 RepID=A0A9N9KWU1_9HELO|nr:hypothetical protein HYFRA_00007662 [Hymenoscyphus fraxineus]
MDPTSTDFAEISPKKHTEWFGGSSAPTRASHPGHHEPGKSTQAPDPQERLLSRGFWVQFTGRGGSPLMDFLPLQLVFRPVFRFAIEFWLREAKLSIDITLPELEGDVGSSLYPSVSTSWLWVGEFPLNGTLRISRPWSAIGSGPCTDLHTPINSVVISRCSASISTPSMSKLNPKFGKSTILPASLCAADTWREPSYTICQRLNTPESGTSVGPFLSSESASDRKAFCPSPLTPLYVDQFVLFTSLATPSRPLLGPSLQPMSEPTLGRSLPSL